MGMAGRFAICPAMRIDLAARIRLVMRRLRRRVRIVFVLLFARLVLFAGLVFVGVLAGMRMTGARLALNRVRRLDRRAVTLFCSLFDRCGRRVLSAMFRRRMGQRLTAAEREQCHGEYQDQARKVSQRIISRVRM